MAQSAKAMVWCFPMGQRYELEHVDIEATVQTPSRLAGPNVQMHDYFDPSLS